MSFMLVRMPLDNRCEPLAEAENRILGIGELLQFIITVLDPLSLADNSRQVRVTNMTDTSLTLLHMRPIGFEPLHDEGIELDGCLWWSYDFTECPLNGHEMLLVKKLLFTYAKAWGYLPHGVYVNISEQIELMQV